MNIHSRERTFAFIDGPNLHATVRALGFEIDYRKLLEYLRQQGQFIRVLYYTAIVEDQEFSTFRPLADWLDYNGYTMVTKPARGFTDANGRRRFRTSMDVELAVDAMRLADKADHIIIFSGEQSFASLASALQQMGKRVTVISTIETQPAMVADELRRQADTFIDIDALQSQIARVGRPPRPPIHEREERFHRGHDEDRRNDGPMADEVSSGAPSHGTSDLANEAAGASTGTSHDMDRDPTVNEAATDAGGTDDTQQGAAVVVKTVRRRRTTST